MSTLTIDAERTTYQYAGLEIRFSKACGAAPCEPGWLVLRNGANCMPGGTYFKDPEEAHLAIDVFKAAEEDGQKFWHLWRALRRTLSLSGKPSSSPGTVTLQVTIKDPCPEARGVPIGMVKVLRAAGYEDPTVTVLS